MGTPFVRRSDCGGGDGSATRGDKTHPDYLARLEAPIHYGAAHDQESCDPPAAIAKLHQDATKVITDYCGGSPGLEFWRKARNEIPKYHLHTKMEIEMMWKVFGSRSSTVCREPRIIDLNENQ